jgi:hypothetical protein
VITGDVDFENVSKASFITRFQVEWWDLWR